MDSSLCTVHQHNNIVAQFSSVEDQLVAKTVIQKALLDRVIVALKLEPTTPDWLASIGGRPLKLGLDLSGGVHFLLEVDVDTALADKVDGLLNSYRKKFRAENINYVSSSIQDDQVTFKFKSSDDYGRALDIFLIDTITPTGLQFDLVEQSNISTLKVSYSDIAIKELRDYAVKQNLMTLRNRVNELGVSEPVVQRQGANRIVVELPGVQDTASAKKINGNLSKYNFTLDQTNKIISYTYNLNSNTTDITELLNDVKKYGCEIKDINTEQSSLEEIFIKLIKENNNELVRN